MLPRRRPVRFALTLTEGDRELLDRLARLQGVSRTALVSRALHHLAVALGEEKRHG